MEKLAEQIMGLLQDKPGKFSCYIEDITRERVFVYNEDEVMPAASLIKVPILYTLFTGVDKGKYNLAEQISYGEAAAVGGSGILSRLSSRPSLNLLDLAELMITLSDNTATNLVINYLGIEAVNSFLKEYNFSETRLQRLMMDTQARKAGRENTTTAREMARLLSFAAPVKNDSDMGPLSENKRTQARDILCRQQFRDKLSYLTDIDWDMIASKTGELPGIQHDASLFLTSEPLLAVTMFQHLPDPGEGRLLHAKIGRMIGQYLKSESQEERFDK
ncbi:MAG: serine hydrolase [Bacillota bacterium]